MAQVNEFHHHYLRSQRNGRTGSRGANLARTISRSGRSICAPARVVRALAELANCACSSWLGSRAFSRMSSRARQTLHLLNKHTYRILHSNSAQVARLLASRCKLSGPNNRQYSIAAPLAGLQVSCVTCRALDRRTNRAPHRHNAGAGRIFGSARAIWRPARRVERNSPSRLAAWRTKTMLNLANKHEQMAAKCALKAH